MEDGLPATGTDVHEHPIVLEPGAARDLRDELEHALRLIRGELGDIAERVDVPLGEDEQMRLGSGVYVTDGDETVGLRNVIAALRQLAEKAILSTRQ